MKMTSTITDLRLYSSQQSILQKFEAVSHVTVKGHH